MPSTDIISIALSKRKLSYYLIGDLLLLVSSAGFIIWPTSFAENPFIRDPAWLRIFGIIALVFFGTLGFFLVRKLRDPAPGLLLTADGFIDNASGLVNGPVAWADITRFQELELMGQKMVTVVLRDPAAYIDQQPNPFKRQLMKTNLNSYGSPVSISANALACSYDELRTLLSTRLAAYQARRI